MMSPNIVTVVPERPDRYQDWLRRGPRSAARPGGEAFCVVVLRLPADPKLFRESAEGFLSDTDDAQRKSQVQSHCTVDKDEERFIKDSIEVAIKLETNEMPRYHRLIVAICKEFTIYQDGDFSKHPDGTEIVYASPPIGGYKGLFLRDTVPTVTRLDSEDATTVAIGVIDDAIAFAHDRFRGQDGKTRVAAFWAQNYEGEYPGDAPRAPFGTVLEDEHINSLLQCAAKKGWSDRRLYHQAGLFDFKELRYVPLAARTGHGTHVMDLAAGAMMEEAPANRPILAVQLPSEVSEDTSGVRLAGYLIHGLIKMFRWADQLGKVGEHDPGCGKDDDNAPVKLVVNFSYGILAGPKDGSHVIERLVDELVEARNAAGVPTRLVMPAGNSYRSRATGNLGLNALDHDALGWRIQPDDRTASFSEIWVRDAGRDRGVPIAVTLTSPLGDNHRITAPEPGKVNILQIGSGQVAAAYADWVDSEDSDCGKAGSFRVLLAVGPTWLENEDEPDWRSAPAGLWTICVENCHDDVTDVSVQIQRDDTPSGFPMAGRQSRLDHPAAHVWDEVRMDYRKIGGPLTHAGTLSGIATGGATDVAGAAQLDMPVRPSDYTSSGPTPGRAAPDASAIADEGWAMRGVMAAGIGSGTVVGLSGTSVAAPQLARQIADEIENLPVCLGGADQGTAQQAGPIWSAPSPERLGCRVLDHRREDVPHRRRAPSS